MKLMTVPLAAGILAASCDTSSLESDLAALEDRTTALENAAAQINGNIIAARAILDGGLSILGCTEREDGTGYDLELSDGSTVSINVGNDGNGVTPVIGIDEEGNWTVRIGNGEPQPIEGSSNAFGEDSPAPMVQVNADGIWQISTDGGQSWKDITDSEGNPAYASASALTDSFFTSVEYDAASGSLKITLADGRELKLAVLDILTMTAEGYDEGEETICLNEALHYPVTFSEDVAEALCTCPDGWRVQLTDTDDGQELIVTGPSSGASGEYVVRIWLQSEGGMLRVRTFTFTLIPVSIDESDSELYNRFISDADDNLLLDYSYAGYEHGEAAPPEVSALGYTVYDVTEYGAVPDDGQSDREAFLKALRDAVGEVTQAPANRNVIQTPDRPSANAIIYFPEGEFILHTSEDDIENGTQSQSIVIRAGNFVLKGAGRDRTRIIMDDPNRATDESVLYSSPEMIQLKHNTGVRYPSGSVSALATVTGDSEKGSFSVTVDGTSRLKPGDWVCLYLPPNRDVVADELYPHTATGSWVIATEGVTAEDLHQVAEVSSGTVTFREPLMHEIKADWGWQILEYRHYENVGVEDLTFVGHAKENFVHHGSWEDDGAYKPISMNRLVNSWIRRVDFESVSEACSVISSANVSVYDCHVGGNRGHASIRSQGSSRVFIGKILDDTDGDAAGLLGHGGGPWMENAGQYHATGVSKLSIGAVLWRNVWGDDACFEAHASQPRATLIDACRGGWMQYRQGGDPSQLPNHLADLTIWNFNATVVQYPGSGSDWIWWDTGSIYWKFLPPVIVGFHGTSVTFDQDPSQVKYIEGNGTGPVTPESLYEAQLRHRLGYVPAWLNALK